MIKPFGKVIKYQMPSRPQNTRKFINVLTLFKSENRVLANEIPFGNRIIRNIFLWISELYFVSGIYFSIVEILIVFITFDNCKAISDIGLNTIDIGI